MDRNTLAQEQGHLNHVLKTIADAKDVLETSMKFMGTKNLDRLKELRENPETSPLDFFLLLEQLHEKNETFNFKDKYQRLDEFESLLQEPYFARIDLENTLVGDKRNIYIGKFGFTDSNAPLVIDWRAKIASVYYRYRYPQKNVEYETPNGKEVRDLTLKRTFEIDSGTLVKYYNNDIQLDESEIIVEKIEQRTGGVLEDIVETIQESQLDIIEADPRQICIVQGCVGSGKSTVAIHKLSHIFFNYPHLIRPQRSILIAKNQILVGYLSTLFPKLGIFDINYKTLRDLVYNLVFREELGIKIDFSGPSHIFSYGKTQIQQLRQKLNAIHTNYQKRIEKVFIGDDTESFGGFVYSRSQTVYENLTEVISDLEEELNHQKSLLKENPNSPQEWLYQSNVTDLRKVVSKLRRLRSDLKRKTLPKLVKEIGIPVRGRLGYIDTLIYMFIYADLIGFTKTLKYEYCVIDEGQDLSLLEYLVLSKFVLNGRLCILGDLNQGYQEEGITSWRDICEIVKEARNANTFELDTNYRSTKPIVELATQILSPYTKDYLPKSINRMGSEPEITTFANQDSLFDKFTKNITKDIDNLNKSVGVLCFSEEIFKNVKSILKDTKIPAEKFVVLNKHKPIHYIPRGVYLTNFNNCKGLEFAKVYILGLNIEKIESFQQAKKAFVAVTRAMNELHIYSVI